MVLHKIFRIILFCVSILSVRTSFSQPNVYIVTYPWGDLYNVNLSNCTATLIGNAGVIDIALTPNGKLWGISYQTLALLDTLTAAKTSTFSNIFFEQNTLVALDDTTLLSTENQTSATANLIKINTKNGVVTTIGNLGQNPSGDFTWYDGSLFYSSWAGMLEIKLNSTSTQILSSNVLNTSVPVYNEWGLGTAMFSDNIIYLIGSQENDIYKICPKTGAHMLLCPAIVQDQIGGMATRRPPFQTPPLQRCSWDVTDIVELESTPTIAIIGNPCNQVAEVKANFDLDDAVISIRNSVGIDVKADLSIVGHKLKINLTDFESGLYILNVSHAGHTATCKLIKISSY